ncbi:MAG TPA: NAD(P)H-dependent oxidoreductase [Candidatus Manganitrophaceae bacterium]|nr:NAD(P)H-dependent oxidoreductase [Candidatus Manganitrophaceae bacterium]
MLNLQVIIVSTRPGRVGLPVGEWFHQHALRHGKFAVERIDLAALNLPLFDEPKHPRLRQYAHPHTQAWSATVARADAFAFVTPEYNYGVPPSLVNALDYLVHEWAYKPVGFVSYGGLSGGTRAVQMAKQIVTALKMMPIPEGVAFPFFTQRIDPAGTFAATEEHRKGADLMLDELLKWAEALRPLRS